MKLKLGLVKTQARQVKTICLLASLAAVMSGLATFGQAKTAAMELTVVPNVIEDWVLPDTKDVPGYQTNEIVLVGCRDEYAQSTFVIRPAKAVSLLAEPTELKSLAGDIIAAKDIDIRIVKCWYQMVSSYYSRRIPASKYDPMTGPKSEALVPELLLKDPDLVKVDVENKVNYVKLKLIGREAREYLKITRDGILARDGTVINVKDPKSPYYARLLQVKDSEKLLPVSIPAGKNQQFYLTAHIPGDAKPGIYEGRISLNIDKAENAAFFKVKLRVLPFELLKPAYISSINHPSTPTFDNKAEIKFFSRSEAQYRAELKNLIAHGIYNPRLGNSNWDDYEKTLKIRQEMGLSNQDLFYFDYNGEVYSVVEKGKSLEWLKDQVKRRIEIARKYGFKDVYFYGLDEAGGNGLLKQRAAWEAVHAAGGKICVAGDYARDWREHFNAMGDLNNLYRDPNYPSRDKSKAWHEKGQKISQYANPQGGVEQPLAYRRNFGLLLWQYDYDCPMTFIYYITFYFGCEWNDLDGKDYAMVYPTEDGVIDTVQWEGYREGVTDVRYVTTLLRHIEEGRKAGGGKAEAALSAETFVAELKQGDVNADNTDLDILRCKMIRHILAIINAR